MHSRLKRLWRGDEKLEGGEGELKQRNLLLQLDNHLEQKLSWFTEAQKSQSPSWVVCFGTLPGDLGTLKAPSDLKQADTARLALQKSMESSRSSLIWIECNPDRYAALVSARSSAAGGQKQHASTSDPSIDLTSSKYHDFFRDLNGNGKLSSSRPVLNGFPSTRRVTMLTLDELVGDDTNPMFLIDLILSRPISNSSAMVS